MHCTSWVKIHPCFQRTLQAICSGCIFTHTSGSWTSELMGWSAQMAARAINNGEKPDPKTTEFCPDNYKQEILFHLRTVVPLAQLLFSPWHRCCGHSAHKHGCKGNQDTGDHHNSFHIVLTIKEQWLFKKDK